jgi:DNA-binding protein H-NS
MSTSRFEDLKAKIAALEAEAAAARAEEMGVVLSDIQAKIETYGFSPKDIFGSRIGLRGKASAVKQAKRIVEPKYRDPKTGAEWSGRGRAPAWIANKKRDRFLIAQP